MEGLQRSAVSFRRQGSSGSVWDDKFLAGLNQLAIQQQKEKENEQNNSNGNEKSQSQVENKDDLAAPAAEARNPSPPPALTIERSRSNGGRGFRTGKVSPAIDPPSPRVSACGFCGAFGKNSKSKNNNTARRRPPPKSGKRVK